MSEIPEDMRDQFDEVAARIISQNPEAYLQMLEDMRNYGCSYLKTNADGSVERIAPELVMEA